MGKSKQSKKDRQRNKEMYNRRKRVKTQLVNELENARITYASRWSKGDATHIENSGYYQWMAGFIDDYEHVFELGTGDGRGTLELARRNHRIVSVDENPDCLSRAFNLLREHGAPTTYFRREEARALRDGSLSIYYSPITENGDQNQVILIQGDILNDEHLLNWLNNYRKFDAAICWQIGSHRMFASLHPIGGTNVLAGEYRRRVQNRMYELCDQILRPDGVLNIIDRIRSSESAPGMLEEIRNAHCDQASVTSLMVIDVTELPYIPPSGGVNMVLSPGSSEEEATVNVTESALCSVTSRKPS